MDRATDFQITEVKLDGKDFKEQFVSLEVYENVLTAAITGSMSCVEAPSNQFLADNKIEGNEEFSFVLESENQQYSFDGFVNRIANRQTTPNGQTTYVVEFTSPFVRNNEQCWIYNRYKDANCEDAVQDAFKRINDADGDKQSKWDKMLGKGDKQNFVASNWSGFRTIQYVMKRGVPNDSGASSTIQPEAEVSTKANAEGKGGFVFFETSRGHCFGSVSQLLRGELGENTGIKLNYELANQNQSMEQNRNQILSFNIVKNNDVQTQQRSGAFKAKQVTFDLDTGHYQEQEWVSPMATEKQLKTAKRATRTVMTPLSNEKFTNTCERAKPFETDKQALTTMQSNGTFENMADGVCQFTIPIRPELTVGDTVELQINEASVSGGKKDEKYSGEWIISSVAHHYMITAGAAYTRVNALRPTDKQESYDNAASMQ